MVYTKQTKRKRDIKTKLMAAVCMLLVSAIMVVSSTYAWFTLSTAPEVTGINTAVGANGNLEMALMPTNGIAAGAGNNFGITSSAGDSAQDATIKNITWGNLVDVSNEAYGLQKITLYPAELNLNNDGTLADLMLKTPTYGADGRVDALTPNTVTSTYDKGKGNFPAGVGSDDINYGTAYGVRGVGVASGMTDRELAYRNFRSTASTAMAQAKTAASQSLNTNGASLANVALAHGVDGDATHTHADVASLQAIVNDLLGIEYVTATADEATHYQLSSTVSEDQGDGTSKEVTYISYHPVSDGSGNAATHKVNMTGKGSLDYIEAAYKNYIVAYAASGASTLSDEEFAAFQSTVSTLSVYDTLDKLTDAPTELSAPLGLLKTTRANVEAANTDLAAITAMKDITWNTISVPLYKLADTDAMEINGIAAAEVKANMSAIINSVASQGLNVTIATNGGVYADIADHCGDYSASIVIKKVEYNNLVLNNMQAKMQTKTTVPVVYLTAFGTVVTTAGAPGRAEGTTMPITDMYGYIIDLAFRTNAAESNLLLQTEATDRIYGTDGTEETMGHGASMTFTSTTTDFTVDQLKNLMSAIRVVFFNPANGNQVLGIAKLDLTEGNYTVTGGNTITAKLYLYETVEASTSYSEATAEQKADTTTTLYTKDADADTYTSVADKTQLVDGTTYYVKVETAAGEKKLTGPDAVITALTQNVATAVSALVYLDGNLVGNDDVAATAATSMTGTMNLQFASSATLVPMEYTPLMNQGTETTNP